MLSPKINKIINKIIIKIRYKKNFVLTSNDKYNIILLAIYKLLLGGGIVYIKNKDLMLLLDIDTYILKTLKNNDNNNGKILHDKLTTLLYQLLDNKKKANIKNYDRIKEKRKLNKNYARSKKNDK